MLNKIPPTAAPHTALITGDDVMGQEPLSHPT